MRSQQWREIGTKSNPKVKKAKSKAKQTIKQCLEAIASPYENEFKYCQVTFVNLESMTLYTKYKVQTIEIMLDLS